MRNEQVRTHMQLPPLAEQHTRPTRTVSTWTPDADVAQWQSNRLVSERSPVRIRPSAPDPHLGGRRRGSVEPSPHAPGKPRLYAATWERDATVSASTSASAIFADETLAVD